MRSRRLRAGAARVCIGVAVAVAVLPGCAASHYRQVACKGGSDKSIFLLEAQAVPSATLIPCVAALPSGWTYGGSSVRSGFVRFWLDSDRVGAHAVEVTMTRTCDVSAAIRVPLPPGLAGVSRYDDPTVGRLSDSISHFLFNGGCVTYRRSFARQSSPAIFDESDNFLGFTPRSVYVKGVRDDTGLTLCGAEAPPCPG